MGTIGALAVEADEPPPLPSKADAMSPADAAVPGNVVRDSAALADGTVAPGVTPRAFAIFLVPVVEASAGEVPRAGGAKIRGAFRGGGALFGAGAVPAVGRVEAAGLAGDGDAEDDVVAAGF